MNRRPLRATATDRKFEFEKLEDKNLLSASAGGDISGLLLPGQQEFLLSHLASQADSAYLQQGASDLQLVHVENGDAATTAVFQQTLQGLPVHGRYLTVDLDSTGRVDNILNPETVFLGTADSLTPSLDHLAALSIANQHYSGHPDLISTSELVWFRSGEVAELAWQIETTLPDANINLTDLDFVTLVDANDGSILSRSQSPSVIDNLVNQFDGIYPRIVINDTIGPAGSQAYADPFDSVVALPGCTGTLIAPNVVISARHCGPGAGDLIRFGEDSANPVFTATVESSFLPDGTGTLLDGGDVAIVTLTTDVPDTVATPMLFIDATNELETMVAATIGYGLNGVGSTGHQGSSDGLRWGGENIIDVYGTPASATGTNIISTDFDDGSAGANTIAGSDPVPLEFEATTAPGDSGGPILVMAGGQWVIAGVLSGGTTSTSVYGDISWWTGTAIYKTDIESFGGQFIGEGGGEIQVSNNFNEILDGGAFDFGVATVGQSITRTFTVTNTDNAVDLVLTEPISVPGAFTVTSSFGQTTLAPLESTTFEVRFDANPIGSYSGQISFETSDGDENPFNFQVTATVASPIGEAGTVLVDGGWTTVFLRNSYIDPVVVAGPASFNDADPVSVRVRNVTSSSFQIRAQEWTYLTGRHFEESVSFVVMESGIHRLSDGTTIVAENTHDIDHNFVAVPLGMEFTDTPVVLAQTVTVNGGATVTTRLDNIDQDSFVVKLQEEEAADQTHNPETVSWLAFLPNQDQLGILNQESDTTGFIVDENVESIPFNVNFDAPPVFLANMQEFVGSNTATVRLAGLTNTEAMIFIEEEQSRDEEVGHGNENVGFLALEEGDIVGRTIIGEAGQVPDLDRDWQTVQLAQNYLDPVVLVSINTFNETDPATVRVRNVTSNSFELHIEEWNYLDLNHAPEVVSYVVFEAGIHRLRDGTIIEAQNSAANELWTQIDFTGDKQGETPLVFSQVASVNGPSTITTRQRNITDTGFEVRVQEEEASATQPHLTERISWVAIREGAGNSGGTLYEALQSVNPVNHVIDTTIPFANTFEGPPVVIANMQTTIGTNTATVRQTFITPGRVDLFVEEERSLDNEVGHVGEDIGVLAFDAGIIDGFIQELFGAPPVTNGRMAGLPLTPNRDPGTPQGLDRSSLDSQSIQNMLLAREQFDLFHDSAFEQMAETPLIHVDLDEATVVPALLTSTSLTNSQPVDDFIRQEQNQNKQQNQNSNHNQNPFHTLNTTL